LTRLLRSLTTGLNTEFLTSPRFNHDIPFTPEDFAEIVEHDREWLEWLIRAIGRKDHVERKRCVAMLPIRFDALRN
jgi:hypothetical protein